MCDRNGTPHLAGTLVNLLPKLLALFGALAFGRAPLSLSLFRSLSIAACHTLRCSPPSGLAWIVLPTQHAFFMYLLISLSNYISYYEQDSSSSNFLFSLARLLALTFSHSAVCTGTAERI